MALCLAAPAARAEGVTLRFMCAAEGNGCAVMSDLLSRFTKANPDIQVTVDSVPAKAVVESLPVQLAAGEGPDLARVSDFGGLYRYLLDISPDVDAKKWEADFGRSLRWLRSSDEDKGIYGTPIQVAVTGAFVNETLFQQANMQMPKAGATWQDWADAAYRVAKANDIPYPIAFERSGHHLAAPAIAYGAKFPIADNGAGIVDDGFRDFARKFLEWSKDGTISKELWVSQSSTTPQDAVQQFASGKAAVFYGSSSQIGHFEETIKDSFDWRVAASPCGPANCTAMPDGVAVVGFKSSKSPEAVAKVLEFLAQEDIQRELASRTRSIPAHQGVIKAGMTYDGASPQTVDALRMFSHAIGDIAPAADHLEAYKFSQVVYNAMIVRLTQAIVGEASLSDALDRIGKDVAEAVKAAGVQ